MNFRIRSDEGCAEQPQLLWDTVWDPQAGGADWALAEPDERQNAGGLRAKAALYTAVILALFTDARVPENHPLRYLAGDDPRGWWGDGVDVRGDLGEEPLGSLLWLLERAPLTAQMVRWAETLATDALGPLLRQQAAVRAEVDATGKEGQGSLELLVRLYGRDGTKVYDRRFEIIWTQTQ